MPSAGKHPFSGFTDTQLRGSYVFGNDRVVTSLMVNVPTGQETQSLKEFNAHFERGLRTSCSSQSIPTATASRQRVVSR